MRDTLTSRVKRIIAGGAHALVDAVEGLAPDAVMEQIIREVDGAMDEVRTELGRVLAGKHLATRRLAEENRKHEELAEKAELAVKQGREDLAEAAVAHQLDIEAQLPILERAIAEAADSEKELEAYLTALNARRREMVADLQAFRAAREKAAALQEGAGGTVTGDVEGKVTRAQNAFERVFQAHGGVPPGTAPDRKSASQLAELEELTRKNRIQERLAAMKARIG
ncbi:MAG TPA: PspA/IM30 family protein [Anaeromyxobacter sp.]|nr:PspA/IM30 family protein [Anaeromyxobacter sp.]